MSQSHLAAILPQKGVPLSVEKRATPEPGAGEVLIEIKAVALNPVDHYQRDFGLFPKPVYPAILGCDVGGVVAKVGSGVSQELKPGTRVAAFVSCFYQSGDPDYGAFQQQALAQLETVIPLPDNLSFEQGALFGVGFMTACTAWTIMGFSLDANQSAQDKQAVLIWGGSSSVGTFSIQTAKRLGLVVYTTASPKHHAYLKQLGAHAVFDYKKSDVVLEIVEAVKKDGMTLTKAHCAVPESLQPSLDVLSRTKGAGSAKVVHSPMLPKDHPTLADTEITFNNLPTDKEERDRHMQSCFHGMLKEGLTSGTIVPSPTIQVEGGGLDGLNSALDKLKAGVSGVKIVVPL
ncbi:GroES-like protein [Setomelanomma holmii]|uniref:GroES-like protein n=1 Tax=Setomelanomma holmii TaxID=210430 RepID=A0A9P4GWM7_9PLEO|nr:GroES-like protein [Setomelanomma holmii]